MLPVHLLDLGFNLHISVPPLMRTICAIFFSVASSIGCAQDLKKLDVFVTEYFDPRASITVEGLSIDPIMAADAMRTALVMNGFSVISERVARERVELKNRVHYTDSSMSQDASVGATTYVNSVYVLTMSYQYRADTGCGGSVMSSLRGQVVDLANEGRIVATYSFRQSSFEGKCVEQVLGALARKLRSNTPR